jgi:amino-acid N-acetyltransferase
MDKAIQILELIKPFVDEGKILPRSYEQIAASIDDFVLLMKSGELAACAGLKGGEDSETGEIYCMAVKNKFQSQGYSEKLLYEVMNKARGCSYSKVFALSKFSKKWFLKYGFVQIEIEQLPKHRQQHIDYKRNSSVFMKFIN